MTRPMGLVLDLTVLERWLPHLSCRPLAFLSDRGVFFEDNEFPISTINATYPTESMQTTCIHDSSPNRLSLRVASEAELDIDTSAAALGRRWVAPRCVVRSATRSAMEGQREQGSRNGDSARQGTLRCLLARLAWESCAWAWDQPAWAAERDARIRKVLPRSRMSG